MHAFKDNAGNTWSIVISVGAIKQVRGLLGLDLLKLVDNQFEGFNNLLSDPITLVDVIYCLCKDEADKIGVTDEKFGRGMSGDSLRLATEAFMEEYTDFFPDPRRRAGIKRIFEASRKVDDRLMERMGKEIDRINIDSVATKLIDSFLSTQESAESIPTHEPIENSA